MGNAESDLNIIRQWMNSHGMELSSKTEFMGFGAAAERIGNSHLTCHSRDCGEACALNCIKIAAVTHFRYLGITVDSGLTWGRHINGVSTSLRSLAFQLYKMRGACSESLMRCYYFALGESRHRYGLLCYGLLPEAGDTGAEESDTDNMLSPKKTIHTLVVPALGDTPAELTVCI
ncbi:hypothetical protein DMENIID0001_071270 [Sergentomyia squamirostris]